MTIRHYYSMQSASDAGENRHPQTVILEHFPDAHDFDPRTIGECWFFNAEAREAMPTFFLPCGDDGVPIWKWHEREGGSQAAPHDALNPARDGCGCPCHRANVRMAPPLISRCIMCPCGAHERAGG